MSKPKKKKADKSGPLLLERKTEIVASVLDVQERVIKEAVSPSWAAAGLLELEAQQVRCPHARRELGGKLVPVCSNSGPTVSLVAVKADPMCLDCGLVPPWAKTEIREIRPSDGVPMRQAASMVRTWLTDPSFDWRIADAPKVPYESFA